MSLHSGTLSRFRANQSLLVRSGETEKLQIPVLLSVVWSYRDPNTRNEHDKHDTTDAVLRKGKNNNDTIYFDY